MLQRAYFICNSSIILYELTQNIHWVLDQDQIT